jgi:aspartate aminotransferase
MNTLKLSNRISSLTPSPIRKLATLAVTAEQQGKKVHKLNIGDPDIKSPEKFLDALKNWPKPQFGYAPSQGDAQFLSSLTDYYKKLGFDYLNKEDILTTWGGSEALILTLMSVANPGDEVITFEPYYTNYNSFANFAGVTITAVSTDIKNGFHFPPVKEVEKLINNKTKAILICNPNNPTGTVYTKEEVEELLKLCVKFNLFIIADEVYREFVYDGKKQISLLEYMDKYPDNIIICDSLSKRYSVCGLRLGALISKNKELLEKTLYYAQARLCAGTLDQYVAESLNHVEKEYFDNVISEYELRRNTLYEGLKNIGIEVTKPEGAFYIVAGLPVKNADDFCKWLVSEFSYNDETVLLAPAAGFYKTPGLGINQVRIAYVQNVEVLKKSLKVLEEALKLYKD